MNNKHHPIINPVNDHYVVGRAYGLNHKSNIGTVLMAAQLAALYDDAAKQIHRLTARVKKLSTALEMCATLNPAAATAKYEALQEGEE